MPYVHTVLTLYMYIVILELCQYVHVCSYIAKITKVKVVLYRHGYPHTGRIFRKPDINFFVYEKLKSLAFKRTFK